MALARTLDAKATLLFRHVSNFIRAAVVEVELSLRVERRYWLCRNIGQLVATYRQISTPCVVVNVAGLFQGHICGLAFMPTSWLFGVEKGGAVPEVKVELTPKFAAGFDLNHTFSSRIGRSGSSSLAGAPRSNELEPAAA